MGVKNPLELFDCSRLPKEACDLEMAWICKADALNAKKDPTESREGKKKGKTCIWGLLVSDTREIKIEVSNLKFPLASA